VTKRTKKTARNTLAAAVAAAVVVTARVLGRRPQAAQGPIKIGISLSLSGDLLRPGKGVKRATTSGRLRQRSRGILAASAVEIVNDASDPNQAVSNYRS